MVRKPLLSAVLITKNAEPTIDATLRSVRFAGEIIVLDDHSGDRTVEISRRHGARIYTDRRPPGGFGPARNLAMSKARGKWILFIDADEVVSPALRSEIMRTIRNPRSPDAFEMPRRNFYFGKWVRFGGRYPDRQRRLFRAGMASCDEEYGRRKRGGHERLLVHGTMGRLTNPLDHHPYPDPDEYLRKLGFYGNMSAESLRAKGIRPGFWTALRYLFLLPVSRFIRRFIF